MNGFEIIGQLLAGWLCADLLTGIFHWWEDRVASPDTPLIGPLIGPWLIEPNRLHHAEPLAFTRGSLAERSQAAFVTSCVISAVILAIFGPSPWLLALWIGGCVVTEVHYHAHVPKPGRLAALLQEAGIIQSPRHHAGHHRPPQASRYCVLTDCCNPLLDAVGFWPLLERGLRIRGR